MAVSSAGSSAVSTDAAPRDATHQPRRGRARQRRALPQGLDANLEVSLETNIEADLEASLDNGLDSWTATLALGWTTVASSTSDHGSRAQERPLHAKGCGGAGHGRQAAASPPMCAHRRHPSVPADGRAPWRPPPPS